MYIMSNKSVYATHWWENVSFAPSPAVEGKKTVVAVFKNTVIDVLVKGEKNHSKLDASLIEDGHIKTYLIIPNQTLKEGGAAGVVFQAQWKVIQEIVGNLSQH